MATPSHWQKSSYSQEGGECIELAISHDLFRLRESDDPTTQLAPSRPALAALLAHVKQEPQS